MGQKLLNVSRFVRRKASQNVFKISIRVVPVELGRLDQAHDRGRSLPSHQRPGEEPILAPGRPRADLLLVVVVVDRQGGIARVSPERGPAFEAVVDRLGRGGAGRKSAAWAAVPAQQVSLPLATMRSWPPRPHPPVLPVGTAGTWLPWTLAPAS